MKRYGFLAMAFAVTLVFLLSSAGLAVFPVPDGTTTVQMQQGWYMDELAWFFCSATDNIRWAQTNNLTLATKLTSFLPPPSPNATRAIIFVTNPPVNQGPIFSQRPGIANYSGIWQVILLTWLPGAPKRPITNNQPASIANPTGIPPVSQATIAEADIVLDCPILAIGPLGGPWGSKPTPASYRIAQGITHNPYQKTLVVPYYNVFCDDPLTKQVMIRRIIITDAATAAVATQLKANLAPRLANGPDADTQRFWELLNPRPPSQLPVIEDCPDVLSWRNTNQNYSPVMRYLQLTRNIPVSTVVNNDTLLLALLGTGGLTPFANRGRINAHVIPYVWYLP